MKRFLIALPFVAALLATLPIGHPSLAILSPILFDTPAAPAAPYVGLGDVFAQTNFFSCTRAVTNAYATAHTSPCRLYLVNWGTTYDMPTLSNGNVDVAGAVTFATSSAGAHPVTCTGATASGSTTMTFTGCSPDPNIQNIRGFIAGTVTSGAITGPLAVGISGCGTFSGGTGTCTTEVAETVTLTGVTIFNGLWIAVISDQMGSGYTANQGPAPIPWYPDCGAGLPCVWGDAQWAVGGGHFNQTAHVAWTVGSFTEVSGRMGDYTVEQDPILLYGWASGSISQFAHYSIPNTGWINNNNNFAYPTNSFTVSDNVVHAQQGVLGATGFVYVDDTLTSGLNTGNSSGADQIISIIFGTHGPWYEAGFSTSQMTSGGGGSALAVCHNQRLYYNQHTTIIPGSC